MKNSRLAAFLFLIAAIALPFAAHAAGAPTVTMGHESAPITIDDYSSLGCPHCADFHLNTLPALKKAYIDTGRVKIIFHHFPLDKASVDGALLVQCVPTAQAWDAITLLYLQQNDWAHDATYQTKLIGFGQMLGLSGDKVKACLNNEKLRDAILQGRLDATNKQQINGTPTLIFNKGAARTTGSQSFDQMKAIIDGLK